MIRVNSRNKLQFVPTRNAEPGSQVRMVGGAVPIRSVPNTVQYSFLLFVFSIPFQNVQVPYVTTGIFSLANLSGLVFFGFYLFHRDVFRNSVPPVPAAIRWFIVYFIIYAVGGLVMDHEPGRAYLLRLISLTQIFGFFWCASDLLKDKDLAKSCLVALVMASIILAVGSLLDVPGFMPASGDRATALGMNPNRVASLMACTALILIAFCLTEVHWSRKRKLFIVLATMPVFAMMVSTGSRAGMAAFIIGMSMFFVARGGLKRKVIASVIAVAGVSLVLFLVVSNPTASRRWERFFGEGDTAGRTEIYATALAMISERPIFGWGQTGFLELGARLALPGRRDAHNFVLYLLIEVGLIGTLPFLIGLHLCILAAWKARASSLGILPLALVVSTLSTMVTHTALGAKTFWLFLALALASAAIVKRRITLNHTIPTGYRARRGDLERSVGKGARRLRLRERR